MARLRALKTRLTTLSEQHQQSDCLLQNALRDLDECRAANAVRAGAPVLALACLLGCDAFLRCDVWWRNRRSLATLSKCGASTRRNSRWWMNCAKS